MPTFSCRLSVLLLVCVCLVSGSTGCSVMMAAKAPRKKNMAILVPGTPRSQVIAELGTPLETQREETETRDVFAFTQGYSLPTRVGRATFHALADVATLGLWEVVATPLEGALEGEAVRTEVLYDDEQTVSQVEYFSGAHLADGGPTWASWLRLPGTQQQAVVRTTSTSQGVPRGRLQQSPGVERPGKAP